MADTKISDLPAATLPLAGTEQSPVTQDGETHRVAISEYGAKLHPGYKTSEAPGDLWYPGWDQPISSSPAYAGNYTAYHPLILPVATTIQRLGINVLGAGSGGTVRLGIYTSVNRLPVTRLVEAPTVSSASTGYKESVLTTPLALAAGCYWLASYASGFAANFTGYSTMNFSGGYVMGSFHPWNWSPTTTNSLGGLQSNNALPTTETSAVRGNGFSFFPAVYFKVSA